MNILLLTPIIFLNLSFTFADTTKPISSESVVNCLNQLLKPISPLFDEINVKCTKGLHSCPADASIERDLRLTQTVKDTIFGFEGILGIETSSTFVFNSGDLEKSNQFSYYKVSDRPFTIHHCIHKLKNESDYSKPILSFQDPNGVTRYWNKSSRTLLKASSINSQTDVAQLSDRKDACIETFVKIPDDKSKSRLSPLVDIQSKIKLIDTWFEAKKTKDNAWMVERDDKITEIPI